ncbi:MAG: DinB family protein [Chloroflexota bacterium]|nr:MAG: Mini-circle protein [Chloroflexota bacterium]
MTDPRPDPPLVASERDMLDAFLEFHQQTLLMKIDGLSEEELRRSFVPSGLTLLGLVKHQAYVHRWWFRYVFAGEDVTFPWTEEDPNADWRIEPGETVEQIVALYRAEVEAARAIVRASHPDDLSARPEEPERKRQLRWVLTHMVEEVCRHNGHADIYRELIDGKTGE